MTALLVSGVATAIVVLFVLLVAARFVRPNRLYLMR